MTDPYQPQPPQPPAGAGWNVAGAPRPGPPSAQDRRHNYAVTLLVLGAVATVAGLILPHIPGYLTTQNGMRQSVASYREVCSSGLGALAQAGSRQIASDCNTAGTVSAVLWAVAIAGMLAAGAGVLLLVQGRRPA